MPHVSKKIDKINICFCKNLNNCFFVGSIFNQIDCNYKKFENKEKLESFLKRRKLKDSIILIKGSRKMKLETLKKLL